jgi:hypothetical protein
MGVVVAGLSVLTYPPAAAVAAAAPLQEETASIEAVLAEADAAEAEAAAVLAEVPSFDLSRELAEAAAYTATGAPVPAAEYQQYLAALKAWDASQVAPVEQATVQQLLAGEVACVRHSTPACAAPEHEAQGPQGSWDLQ